MLRYAKFLIFTVMLVVFVSACAVDEETNPVLNDPEGESEAVAIVNGEEITQLEFDQSMNEMITNFQQQGLDIESTEGKEWVENNKEMVLDRLINQKILQQEIINKGYTADPAVIEEEINSIKTSFESEEEFNSLLSMYNITLEDLKEDIIYGLKMEQFVKDEVGDITVAAEEIQEYYDIISQQQEEIPEFEDIKLQLQDDLESQKIADELHQIVINLKEQSEIEIKI